MCRAFIFASLAVGLAGSAAALGSTCKAPLGSGRAAPGDPYWLESITHQGSAPYASSNYTVFRNVKDYGAAGDGVTDDTEAINAAITDGDRCTDNCYSSTLTPATVYFPSGTYLVSETINAAYYTELVGDARELPTLLVSPDFNGSFVIDADPYRADGSNWYINQNSFYRTIRNLVIDMTAMNETGTGIHWQVSQATSLYNVVVEMNTDNTTQRGLYMENGSGGFMGDLVFNGGAIGMSVGNQQFTARNITVNNAITGISAAWGWGWTYQGLKINNCSVGFEMVSGVGSESIIDAVITDTPIFINRSVWTSELPLIGSLVLSNVKLNNVETAVGGGNDTVFLAGGTHTIDAWIQGDVFSVYSGERGALVFSGSSNEHNTSSEFAGPIPKPDAILDHAGRVLGKTRPSYADYAVSEFVSVKDEGAVGDGETDDTAALQAVFDKYAGCKIIFFDAGIYIVSSTLKIPAGVHVTGEAWSTIMGSGSAFASIDDPTVVVKVGTHGSQGAAEFSSMLFTTRAPAGGAIIVEWNVHDPWDQQGAAGMWDTLFRIGGAVGTDLQLDQCGIQLPTNGSEGCQSAFLGLHITSSASAYLEGTWVWTADHDVDSNSSSPDVTIFTGRGLLSESRGPVWLIGTASEHAALYQYNFVNAADHYLGFTQTESAYYQPIPAAPEPFSMNAAYHDPPLSGDGMGWAMNFANSDNMLMFGAGFYTWFANYSQTCQGELQCQRQTINFDAHTAATVVNLNTVGVRGSLSVSNSVAIWASEVGNGFANTIPFASIRPAAQYGGEAGVGEIFQQLLSAEWGPMKGLSKTSLTATVRF